MLPIAGTGEQRTRAGVVMGLGDSADSVDISIASMVCSGQVCSSDWQQRTRAAHRAPPPKLRSATLYQGRTGHDHGWTEVADGCGSA